MSDTTAAVKHGPVKIENWRCNGTINPLIREYPQLCKIAGPELPEALRWCSIAMECYYHEGKSLTPEEAAKLTNQQGAALFYSWYQHSHRLINRGPEIMPGIQTTAQLLAKHGNLYCLAECVDCIDLCKAISLTRGYNDFDPQAVSLEFGRFNLARIYPTDNPNAGRDAFKYYYGCECSAVIYIEANFRYGLRVMDRAWQHWTELDPQTFGVMVKELGRRCRADECNQSEETECSATWRLWWD